MGSTIRYSPFGIRPLRPDRHVRDKPRRAQRLGEARELAEQRTGFSGIDDLLDPELLGRAERRAQLVESVLDLLQFRRGIIGGVDLGAVGGFYAAFQRQ